MSTLDEREGSVMPRETAEPGSMSLRIVRFLPRRIAFDRTLRETILPDLARHDEVLDILAGRSGPDEVGPRLLMSLWTSSHAAASRSDEDPERLRSRYAGETDDHHVEILPVVFAVRERWAPDSGIVRLARGKLRELPVARYAEDVRDGLASDLRSGHGPISLVLAQAGDRTFVTASCWADWVSLARATGTSLDQPIHTRRMEDVLEFNVEHFELLPVSRSAAGPTQGG